MRFFRTQPGITNANDEERLPDPSIATAVTGSCPAPAGTANVAANGVVVATCDGAPGDVY